MLLSPRFLKGVRLTHLYLGVFVAPALLFFAFTGAVQTFSLHETTRGSSYQPPRILVLLAQIHKKQTPILTRKPQAQQPEPARHVAPQDGPHADKRPSTSPAPQQGPPPNPDQARGPAPQHNPLPLKIFFLIVSIGLCLSTFSGLYMAYKYSRSKTAITTLLILGVVIPVLMILL